MKHTQLRFVRGFEIMLGDTHSQAGTMVLPPDGREGGPANRHVGADQWIYVVSGTGQAQIAGETISLEPHTLILIQRGDAHGFHNTSTDDLKILTFYVPPAYTSSQEELPAGRADLQS